MKEKSTFLKIITADNSILGFLVMSLLGLGYSTYLFFNINDITNYSQIGMVILLLFYTFYMFYVFIKRFRFFYNIIKHGIEVEGIIDEVKTIKDKVGIYFTYEYEGVVHKWGNTAATPSKIKQAKSMVEGTKIKLLIDEKTKKAVIKDLL